MVNQSYPSLANAESMSELPSVLPVFVEGWRRLVESDTVRTTDTLQHDMRNGYQMTKFVFQMVDIHP